MRPEQSSTRSSAITASRPTRTSRAARSISRIRATRPVRSGPRGWASARSTPSPRRWPTRWRTPPASASAISRSARISSTGRSSKSTELRCLPDLSAASRQHRPAMSSPLEQQPEGSARDRLVWPELAVDKGRPLDTPTPRRQRPDDDVLHWSKPAVALLDRRRAVDLYRHRVHGIDGGEAVDDQRNLASIRRDVLVFPRSGEVLVAPNQNLVSIELEADHVGVGLA